MTAEWLGNSTDDLVVSAQSMLAITKFSETEVSAYSMPDGSVNEQSSARFHSKGIFTDKDDDVLGLTTILLELYLKDSSAVSNMHWLCISHCNKIAFMPSYYCVLSQSEHGHKIFFGKNFPSSRSIGYSNQTAANVVAFNAMQRGWLC